MPPKILKLFTIISMLTCTLSTHAATLRSKTIAHLPKQLKEISGLTYIKPYLWAISDSRVGKGNVIYALSPTTGKIIKKVRLKKVKYKDWEALTHDDKYLYLGDIGNNSGNRKNLIIYKIPRNKLQANKKITPSRIYISYKNQTSFKTKTHQNEFDAESLFVHHNKLYLISKNWVSEKSQIYPVPKTPGRYRLSPIQTVCHDGLSTDATAYKNNLFVVSYTISLFGPKPSLIDYYLKGQSATLNCKHYKTFRLIGLQQVESVAFLPPNQLYIAQEKGFGGDALLAKVDVHNFEHI